jgi:tRNA pseudouridine38-40 synthase
MRNLRAKITYDGSRFAGWQRQDGFSSVQGALEDALAALLGEPIHVCGSGRTDAGVHALGQVASFHADTRISDRELVHAINAHLAEGVAVRAVETCRDDFHAQKSARGKRYAYLVATSSVAPPFGRSFVHWIRHGLDVAAVRRGARHFLGEHDFSAFSGAGSPRGSNVRRVDAVHLVARRKGFAIVVQGNGFLYHQVRTMVGALLDVGRGRVAPDEIRQLLAGRDRTAVGATAPAQGLYLLSVLYDEPCFLRAPSAPAP